MGENFSIIQVLMSLFSDSSMYGSEKNQVQLASSEQINEKLRNVGLSKNQIKLAKLWFKNFSMVSQQSSFSYSNSIRVFSREEQAIIPSNCLSFLIESYHSKIINSFELEFVVNQVLFLEEEKRINEEQFMWIYDMTLANQSHCFYDNGKDQNITSSSLPRYHH